MITHPILRSTLGLLTLLAVVAAGYGALSRTLTANAGGTDYTVTNLDDPGNGVCDNSCTLREALDQANLGQGNRVKFDVPGCPPACTITLASALPTITQLGTVIDGATQPGHAQGSPPLITIDGTGLPAGTNGLVITAPTTVRGVRITNFPQHGIYASATTLSNLTVDQSDVSANGVDGLNAAVSGALAVSQSSFDGNGASGIYASNFTATDANISDTSAVGNGFDGLNVAVSNSLMVTDSVATGNTQAGLYAGSSTMTSAVLDGNTFSDNGFDGANLPVSSTLTVTDNVIRNNDAGGVYAGSFTVADADFEGNDVGNNAFDGIKVAASNTLTVIDNDIYLNGLGGLYAGGFVTTSGEIAMNNIRSNTSGGVTVNGAGILVHHNLLSDNNVGLFNAGGGVAPAEDNWWGCNEGPNEIDCDSTAGGVDADPWLVLDVAVAPDTIGGGEMATATAHVNMNSDGADTSGDGHIPDGTLVILYADSGMISTAGINASKATTNGEASAQFTADAGPGQVTLGALLDNEDVTTQLTVTEATPTPTPTPSGTPTATATTSPTATPTATPGEQHLQGDVDCDGDVDAVDALKILQFIAGLPFSQEPGCPSIGELFGDHKFGDVDCDGDVDAVDALKVLQFVAAIPFGQSEPCANIGSALG